MTGFRVLAAIRFDDEARLIAHKIRNVRPYWRLAPEFGSNELPVAQDAP
jgi:hypothetical protein